MFETTTIPAADATDARGRARRKVLTNRDCASKSGKPKAYDAKCDGLYVRRTTTGPNTFSALVRVKGTRQKRPYWLGCFDAETFNVDHARSAYYALMARIDAGENVFATARRDKRVKTKQGRTVDDLAIEYLDYIREPVKKKDGKMRARIESHKIIEGYFRNLVSPRFGRMTASDLTNDDVATLACDMMSGKYNGKPSVSSARHMRTALSGLYRWAREAGRGYVIKTCQPMVDLPSLPAEHPRTRALTPEEIRILWQGLERDDLPWDRMTCLAIKFGLATMLRSWEFLAIHHDELHDLDGKAFIRVPVVRVKKRRIIEQPLNSLALDILREAMKKSNQREFVFFGRFGAEAPLARKGMAEALRGTKKTPGLCALLGLKPFTPHDLRRTAATLLGNAGFGDGIIGRCLDHHTTRDRDGTDVSRVTGVYNQSTYREAKRPVLDALAVRLREIISEPDGAGQLAFAFAA
ncbi:hypothetical protein XH99_01000 [Bradyrhizobium nanningense]|uniref:Tyr recombinase domain-containing protein n=2 Tax=Bradyrhizobium nanningense TaxID=1325118 RepID=A0A4Q0SII8_9BRAD|nr:hypothetical protein XH84_06960 [Bradyrhizobium nanningense]RXH38370.1 hypothetical protein XH99_01000 [Bradyrhizobium nanningense]